MTPEQIKQELNKNSEMLEALPVKLARRQDEIRLRYDLKLSLIRNLYRVGNVDEQIDGTLNTFETFLVTCKAEGYDPLILVKLLNQAS
jgi:hypothetical protein